MEAKEFLRQYRDALLDIKNVEAELKELNDMKSSTGGLVSDGIRSTIRKDKIAGLVSKICDTEIVLMDKRTEALGKMKLVSSVIKKVQDSTHRRLLHMRYIEGLQWEKIAVELHYTYRWTTELHGKILQEVKMILDSEKSSF